MASKIIVEGFKSIGKRVEVEVRPLTLLAGANSSGKSSLMQAILLLKQTLEANFDPGPLLLNGPNVRFTSVDQLLHIGSEDSRRHEFSVGLQDNHDHFFESHFAKGGPHEGVRVAKYVQGSRTGRSLALSPSMRAARLKTEWERNYESIEIGFYPRLEQERFMLSLSWHRQGAPTQHHDGLSSGSSSTVAPGSIEVGGLWRAMSASGSTVTTRSVDVGSLLRALIHIPGLRGNPERSYPLTASGPTYSGTFERYTASVIARWSTARDPKIKHLCKNLESLGLTSKIEAKRLDDASLELRVSRRLRHARGGGNDLVNIADVGLGVSQTLPVVVALLEAKPGQLVFIEQPEIHLHPRAQVAMAGLLADAAKRGVQLVIETHSSLLLLAVQTLVAEGDLDPELVKLHWFTRDEKTGATKITSAELDEAGRFGDWPEDFADVSLEAEARYMDAAEAFLVKEE